MKKWENGLFKGYVLKKLRLCIKEAIKANDPSFLQLPLDTLYIPNSVVSYTWRLIIQACLPYPTTPYSLRTFTFGLLVDGKVFLRRTYIEYAVPLGFYLDSEVSSF